MNRGDMRRTLLITALVAASLLAATLPVGAADADPPAWIFPVVGQDGVDFAYGDTYGAPRSGGRSHEGVDIGTYGVKGVPVVAAAAGVVRYVNWSSNPADLNPERCCTISIDHADGWRTSYIHLDNDTPGTDDGNGWGIADGIVPGVTVQAGQLIGWVGDSGNAERVYPHLHWEVHSPSGVVNPTPHADNATRISAPIPLVWDGHFWDDDTSVHEANIDIIADLDITRGCNPPDNTMYCPEHDITRGQMAAFIRRMLNLPAVEADHFSDDAESIFEGDINAITEAGIGFGCSETNYCADTPLIREEMAEFLVRAFGYDNPDGLDLFTDDDGSAFQDSINALGVHDITKGCNPPDNDQFCPDRTLTRAEMASFFARALELGS
ncbi:MAG: M23 family metallopeptidase, partial [Acidimicrobiia bacterium]